MDGSWQASCMSVQLVLVPNGAIEYPRLPLVVSHVYPCLNVQRTAVHDRTPTFLSISYVCGKRLCARDYARLLVGMVLT